MLTFDENSHEYRLDGLVIPSVTQVLAEAGLIDTRWFTDEGRERGEDVHLILEAFDQGELYHGNIRSELRPYLNAWQAFLTDSKFTVKAIEQPVCNELLKYAGTPDRIGFMGNLRALVDIKTGPHYPGYCIQTAGYAECFDPPIRRRIGVHLKADGTYKLHVHDDPNDAAVFFAALAVANWKRNHGVKTNDDYAHAA